MRRIFLNACKKFPEISFPLSRNRQKTEVISLSYDVNDYDYSKSKCKIHLLRTALANIEVILDFDIKLDGFIWKLAWIFD